MQNYQGFTMYEPENIPVEALNLENGMAVKITWLRDENGNDWYDVQQNFADDTLKVLYDGNSIICGCSMDVTELNPVNMSVAEVDIVDIPAEAIDNLADGSWCYLDGNIKKREQYPDEIKKIKADMMLYASVIIGALQDAVDMRIATGHEVEMLTAWRKYRVLLSRVNINKPDFPERPE
ncbi:tail fiber assembly protein [Trabulsiella odontotermitis]|uniref:tail fiber assembly protein n=1 Tax=Trabulsiella odontotermitis TaxID=379893 RepID=UPI0006763FA5|nr:tail assembly chaperone [Trabulsiella odontotermitis]